MLEFIAVGALASKIYFVLSVLLFVIILLMLKYRKEFKDVNSELTNLKTNLVSIDEKIVEILTIAKDNRDKLIRHHNKISTQEFTIVKMLQGMLGRRGEDKFEPELKRRYIDQYESDRFGKDIELFQDRLEDKKEDI